MKSLFLTERKVWVLLARVYVHVFSRESNSASSLLADPRVNLLTNGGLEILNVTHDDEGFYTCSVQNTNLSVSAELEILSK